MAFVIKRKERNINDFNIRSGKRIFEEQLKHCEGTDIVISNANQESFETRVLLQNKENIYSDSKEFRNICFKNRETCDHGSYVEYMGENYMVITDVDFHHYYYSCKIRKCGQIARWKDKDGVIHEFPCIISNDSYGVKTNLDNLYISDISAKSKILIQRNIETDFIDVDWRFAFNGKKRDIFKSLDVTTATVNGILDLTCKKDSFHEEDDLITNICWINDNAPQSESMNLEVLISGDDEIVQGQSKKYKCTGSEGYYFEIDGYDLANGIGYIVSDIDGECEVFACKNKSTEYLTLNCRRNSDGVIVANKIITCKKA